MQNLNHFYYQDTPDNNLEKAYNNTNFDILFPCSLSWIKFFYYMKKAQVNKYFKYKKNLKGILNRDGIIEGNPLEMRRAFRAKNVVMQYVTEMKKKKDNTRIRLLTKKGMKRDVAKYLITFIKPVITKNELDNFIYCTKINGGTADKYFTLVQMNK